MNCPVCDDKLREVSRNGVDIDICPSCKGVWLDRGELEKILDMVPAGECDNGRARGDIDATRQERTYVRREEHDDHRRESGHHDDHDDHDRGRIGTGSNRKRRGSWLSDILEGFGGGD